MAANHHIRAITHKHNTNNKNQIMFGLEDELQNEIARLKEENAGLKLRLSNVRNSLNQVITHSFRTGGCLCGRGEWCENCDPDSGKNKLLKNLTDIRKLLD